MIIQIVFPKCKSDWHSCMGTCDTDDYPNFPKCDIKSCQNDCSSTWHSCMGASDCDTDDYPNNFPKCDNCSNLQSYSEMEDQLSNCTDPNTCSLLENFSSGTNTLITQIIQQSLKNVLIFNTTLNIPFKMCVKQPPLPDICGDALEICPNANRLKS